MKTSRMLNHVPKIKNLNDSGHEGSPTPFRKLAVRLAKDRLSVSGWWPPFSSSGDVSVYEDMIESQSQQTSAQNSLLCLIFL